ncbi:hypothetical protein UFOVP32_52 [uncultured Caudovirales phage]|uniref:COG5377 Phage-related protein, predicted endonuclease n=1 Tax=uncultured Caudovirales phage TaxID=2100421 RepID=A0A6J5KRI7_9CAUD|nr:hypothetical protein UFOVP32_52 [uncultured Caudovirales phage]CAB4123607.1 COG5377 Phage-related protein, predicted endonuclease [uncultured Caudovirales phage]
MPTIALKDENEWLAIRDSHIGGSEIAALFTRYALRGSTVTLHAFEPIPDGASPLGSCSPYTSAYKVWLTKAGKVMPEGWNPSERMNAGTYLEPALAQWAQAKWGWRLRKVRRYHQHDAIQGWGSSLDYEVHGPGLDPVEFKNIDGLIAKRDWVIEGDEILVAPLHIQLQVQHYLGARNAKRAWIVACVGGNQLVRGEFARHEPTIARIAEAIAAFWASVAADAPPEHAATYDAVADQFAFGDALAPPADLNEDDEAAMLARRYLRIKQHSEFTEAALANVKGRLALKIGEATKARGDGFRVSWPVIERAEKTIPARLQTAKTYRGGFTVTAI